MAKKIDKQEKKQQILHAAIQAFTENGIFETRMIDIAKKADIGKGTLYEYFNSKKEISEQAFHYWLRNMDAEVVEQIKPITNPKTKLHKLIMANIDYFEANKSFLSLMFDFWSIGLRKDKTNQMKIVEMVYTNYISSISKILQQGIQEGYFIEIDTAALASTMVGALDGILLQWIIFGDEYDIRNSAKTFIDVIIKGIET